MSLKTRSDMLKMKDQQAPEEVIAAPRDVILEMPEGNDTVEDTSSIEKLKAICLGKVFFIYFVQMGVFFGTFALVSHFSWEIAKFFSDLQDGRILDMNITGSVALGTAFTYTANLFKSIKNDLRKPLYSYTALVIYTILLAVIFAFLPALSPFGIIIAFSWVAIGPTSLLISLLFFCLHLNYNGWWITGYTIVSVLLSLLLPLAYKDYSATALAAISTFLIMLYILINTRRTLNGGKFNVKNDTAGYLVLRVCLDLVTFFYFNVSLVLGPAKKKLFS